MSATIADFMSWTSLTIRPQCAARDALAVLAATEASEVFVTDHDDGFHGVLTDYEVLKAELNGSLDEVTAGELMQCSCLTLSPETSIRDAAKTFRDGRRACLPVVRDGRLLGLIQRRDVLRWMVGQRSLPVQHEIQPPKFLQRTVPSTASTTTATWA